MGNSYRRGVVFQQDSKDFILVALPNSEANNYAFTVLPSVQGHNVLVFVLT
jgi:hypothetical protein